MAFGHLNHEIFFPYQYWSGPTGEQSIHSVFHLFQGHHSNTTDTLFEECLSSFFLEQAQDIFQSFPANIAESYFPQVNEVMELLEESVTLFCQILDEKVKYNCGIQSFNFITEVYEERCAHIRKSLEERVQSIESAFSASYKLDSPSAMRIFKHSVPVIPTHINALSRDVRERALKNISSIDLPSDLLVISSLLAWVKRNKKSCDSHKDYFIHAQLILKKIETFIFHQFLSLFEGENFAGIPGGDSRTSECFVIELDELIENYLCLAKDFIESKHSKSRMNVNINSHQVLVCIVALCFIFECTKSKYPLLEEYSLAISFEDLKNLVFIGSEEINILKKIYLYLVIHQTGRQIFDLTHQNFTHHLARRFGLSYLSSTWARETNEARARVDARWQVILQKKDKLKTLRPKLVEAQRELDLLPEEYQNGRGSKSSEYFKVQEKINKLKKEIKCKDCSFQYSSTPSIR
jgi:hypothetical protein